MSQFDEQPPMNKAMEDILAAMGSEEGRVQAIGAWLLLGAEYMARECGRRRAIDVAVGLREFLETAEPSTPWPA